MLLRNLNGHWLRTFALGTVLACLGSPQAHGDVGVVLNESLDTSIARITGSGHTAVYLSRICPETPVKLRLCRADEQGSVISNYTTLGEDQPFEWNVVPLSVYLYGVENPQFRPMVGSQKIKRVLEERYRENYLSAYCTSESCRTSNKAEWREMVGATLSRSIYMFVAETTVDQDLALIAEFNSLPNRNHFNGMTRNCADFARRIVNAYFPRATGPDYVNDFGMTSPKAIARSFTRYALRHPESHFRVVHYTQIPGTIKRSSECRAGTEQLYRSKKLLVPMLIFANQALPFVAASYLFTGRFNPQRELEKHPSLEASSVDDGDFRPQLDADVVGTTEDWKAYRTVYDSVVRRAIHEEVIRDRGELKSFFQQLDDVGTPVADRDGALWIELANRQGTLKVGISASNILDSASDSHLAYVLLLARTGRVLSSPKHSRESMVDFRRDWELLQGDNFHPSRSVLRAAAPLLGSGAMSFAGK